MKTKREKFWTMVRPAAEALGVKKNAIHQWKHRDVVPYKWRHKIVKITRGKLRESDFGDD